MTRWRTALAVAVLALLTACSPGIAGQATGNASTEDSGVIYVTLGPGLPGDYGPAGECLGDAEPFGPALNAEHKSGELYAAARLYFSTGCQAVWLKTDTRIALQGYTVSIVRRTDCDASSGMLAEAETAQTNPGQTVYTQRLGYNEKEHFFSAAILQTGGRDHYNEITCTPVPNV